jgi:hypothetical protein
MPTDNASCRGTQWLQACTALAPIQINAPYNVKQHARPDSSSGHATLHPSHVIAHPGAAGPAKYTPVYEHTPAVHTSLPIKSKNHSKVHEKTD